MAGRLWIIYGEVSSQAHFCKITLFATPASLIVCVSSSSVLLGKVVPIVYGRAKLAGLDLGKSSVSSRWGERTGLTR